MNPIENLILGQYKIEHFVAEGPSGILYRGSDLQQVVPVAIKCLHTKMVATTQLDKIISTALASNELNHPHIVRTFQCIQNNNQFYIISEWVNGNVLDWKSQTLRGTLESKLSFFNQCLDALTTAHQAGIVHGNLKPSNIFHDADALPKLADFGLGIPITATTSALEKTRYCAPEQYAGQEPDARSDVYVFGILLYEALKQRVFLGTLAPETFSVQNTTLFAQPVSALVFASVTRILGRALATNPDERFQNAGAFKQALTEIIAQVRASPINTAQTKSINTTLPSRKVADSSAAPLSQTATNTRESGEQIPNAAPRSTFVDLTPHTANAESPYSSSHVNATPTSSAASPHSTTQFNLSGGKRKSQASTANDGKFFALVFGLFLLLILLFSVGPRILQSPKTTPPSGEAQSNKSALQNNSTTTPTFTPIRPTVSTSTPVPNAAVNAAKPPQQPTSLLPPEETAVTPTFLPLDSLKPFQNGARCQYNLRDDTMYSVRSRADQTICGAVFPESYGNVRVQARLKMLSGDGIGGGNTILIFGYQSPKNFFGATFTRVGRLYSVAHWQNGVPKSIVYYNWAEALHRPDENGATENNVLIQVNGRQLFLYVNGTPINLFSLDGFDYRGGQVGVGVFTTDPNSPTTGGESVIGDVLIQPLP